MTEAVPVMGLVRLQISMTSVIKASFYPRCLLEMMQRSFQFVTYNLRHAKNQPQVSLLSLTTKKASG